MAVLIKKDRIVEFITANAFYLTFFIKYSKMLSRMKSNKCMSKSKTINNYGKWKLSKGFYK